jgi:hypothetical protein
MKLKLLLGILFVAGVASALAVAAPTRADSGGSTTTTVGTTTTRDHHEGKKDDDHEKGDKPTCKKVELKGPNGSGTVALTVSRANHGGSSLVGKQVTLTIPAGATLKANACLDAAGALTLRELHVELKHPATTTTTTTTTHS